MLQLSLLKSFPTKYFLVYVIKIFLWATFNTFNRTPELFFATSWLFKRSVWSNEWNMSLLYLLNLVVTRRVIKSRRYIITSRLRRQHRPCESYRAQHKRNLQIDVWLADGPPPSGGFFTRSESCFGFGSFSTNRTCYRLAGFFCQVLFWIIT